MAEPQVSRATISWRDRDGDTSPASSSNCLTGYHASPTSHIHRESSISLRAPKATGLLNFRGPLNEKSQSFVRIFRPSLSWTAVLSSNVAPTQPQVSPIIDFPAHLSYNSYRLFRVPVRTSALYHPSFPKDSPPSYCPSDQETTLIKR